MVKATRLERASFVGSNPSVGTKISHAVCSSVGRAPDAGATLVQFQSAAPDLYRILLNLALNN